MIVDWTLPSLTFDVRGPPVGQVTLSARTTNLSGAEPTK